MNRCTRCILPDHYPGISFNMEGLCSFCDSYQPKKYLGNKILRENISAIIEDKKGENDTYDCVVGISGGRDSNYLLWYAVKKLKLKVVSYTADNGFVPEVAMRNMHNITKMLGVDLVVEKTPYLKKCFKQNIKTFMQVPSPAMIGVLCAGCKVGIDLGLMHFTQKSRIPLVLSGGSPLEVGYYKRGLLRSNPVNKKIYTLVLGYFREVINNMKWISHYPSLTVQFKEFYHVFYRKSLKKNTKVILPFYEYVEWNEKMLTDTLLNEIGWEFNSDKNSSTWKTDCYIAPLKKYLYKKMLGFNDIDDHLSALVRVGQISREEALKRLSAENSVKDQELSDACNHLGVDWAMLEKALERKMAVQRNVL